MDAEVSTLETGAQKHGRQIFWGNICEKICENFVLSKLLVHHLHEQTFSVFSPHKYEKCVGRCVSGT